MGKKKKRRFQRMKNLQKKVNKTLKRINSLKKGNEMTYAARNTGLGTRVIHTSGGRDDAWEVELDMVDECGKAPETILVLIDPLAKTKIDLLMKTYKSREWLAYLVGENNVVFDIVVPDQIASGASVTNVNFPNKNNLPIIGVIHSHHNMGAGFSGVDDEWINQNHDISIVISHTGMSGQVRWKAPCSAMKVVPANIRLNIKVDYDKDAFLKDSKEKIKAWSSGTSGKDIQGRKIILRSKYEPGKVKVETEGFRYNQATYKQDKVVYIDWVDPADADPDVVDPDDIGSVHVDPDVVDEIEQMIDDWDKGDINPDEWDTTVDPDEIALEQALDDKISCFGRFVETDEDCQICSSNLECKVEAEEEEITPQISYTKLPKELDLALRNPSSFLPNGYLIDSKGFLKGPNGLVKLTSKDDLPDGYYFLDKDNYLKIKSKTGTTEEIIGTASINVEDLPEGYYRDSKGCLRGPDGKFVRKKDIIANV